MRSAALHEQFRRDGYVVLRELLSAAEVQTLKDEIPRLLDVSRAELALPDGDAVASPVELLDLVLCVHHAHKLSEAFLRLASHAGIVEAATSILGPHVKCLQSQVFVKCPGMPGNAWHQDEGPIPTRDRSLLAAWIALDEATVENGCLRVIPGSHSSGYLYPVREHGQPDEYDFTTECYEFDATKEVVLELSPGSVVLFDGYLVHGSRRNRSASRRRAVTYHYMNAYSPLPWAAARADYRDVFMVAGEDPYAWKGYEDLSIPHLRAWQKQARHDSGDAGIPPAARAKVARAIGFWAHDERRAIELFSEALRDIGDDGAA